MSIISKQTAYRIWTAHKQIEAADKLLVDITETLRTGGLPTPQDPHNYGRRGYSLGLPHGSGERVLNVSPRLAGDVILVYRQDQVRELALASEDARIELGIVMDEMFEEVEPAPAPVRPPDPSTPEPPDPPDEYPPEIPF